MLKIIYKPIIDFYIYFESNNIREIQNIIHTLIINNRLYAVYFYICIHKCLDISYIKNNILKNLYQVLFSIIQFDIPINEKIIQTSLKKTQFIFINATSKFHNFDFNQYICYQKMLSINHIKLQNISIINSDTVVYDQYHDLTEFNYFHINCIIKIHTHNNKNYISDSYNQFINFKSPHESYITILPNQYCTIIPYNNAYVIKINNYYLGLPNKNRLVFLYDDIGVHTLFTKISNTHLIYNNFIFNKEHFEIVVSRFNENIEWTIPYNDICTIYNKNIIYLENSIHLLNVGRESHTYLWHIIHNYNNLSDNILFTQGNMSDDHTPFCINKYMQNKNLTLNLQNKGTINSNRNTYGFIIHNGKWLDEYNSGDMEKETMNFKEWWNFYIRKTLPKIKNFVFSHGAIFSVSKDIIHENSLGFYIHLIKSVETHKNPESGHYFERAWFYIFNGNIKKNTH